MSADHDDHHHDHDDLDDLPTRAAGGRRRPKAAGRQAAQLILRRLAWTARPLVWHPPGGDAGADAGPPRPAAKSSAAKSSEPRRVTAAIDAVRRRLHRMPPGVYAVEFAPAPGWDAWSSGGWPAAGALKVVELLPVDRSLIASGLRRLLEARRFPKLIPELVGGDADAWRARVEHRLAAARAAVEAAEDVVAPGTRLALAATCLWAGAPATDDDAVAAIRAAADAGSPDDPAARAAAVVLGQRPDGGRPPAAPRLQAWWACGRRLRGWPADVVLAAADRLGSPPALLAALADAGVADDDLAAPDVAREVLLTTSPDRDDLPLALRCLAAAARAADRVRLAIDRRFGTLVDVQRECVEAALVGSGVDAAGRVPQRAPPPSLFRELYKQVSEDRAAELDAAQVDLAEIGRARRVPHVSGRVGPVLAAAALRKAVLGERVDGDRVTARAAAAVAAGTTLDDVKERSAAVLLAVADDWRGRIDARRDGRVTAAVTLAVRSTLHRTVDVWAEPWAAWVDACCRLVRPGVAGATHWAVAAGGLLDFGAAADGWANAVGGGAAADGPGVWRIVARHADGLLRFAARTESSWPPTRLQAPHVPAGVDRAARFATIAARAALTDREAAECLAGAWAGFLCDLSPGADADPARVRAALRWLDGVSDTRYAPDATKERYLAAEWYRRRDAAAAWATLDPALLTRVAAHFAALGGSPREQVEWLTEVADFAFGGVAAKDADRGAILRRQRLLRAHPKLLADAGRPVGGDVSRRPLWPRPWGRAAEVVAAWSAAGWGGVETLWDALIDRLLPAGSAEDAAIPSLLDDIADPAVPNLLAVARGDPARGAAVAEAGAAVNFEQAASAAKAWRWVERTPRLADLLSACADREPSLRRLLKWLPRLALCLRLPTAGRTAEALAKLVDVPSRTTGMAPSPGTPGEGWGGGSSRGGHGTTTDINSANGPLPNPPPGYRERGPEAVALDLPNWLPPALRDDLSLIASLAGGALPKRVAAIVRRDAALRAERDTLAAIADPPPKVAKRRVNLDRYLADPAALHDWVVADLAKCLPPLRDDLLLAAVERAADDSIGRHLGRLLGSPPPTSSPDWDNAVRLYFTIDANRSLLLRLMRHRAATPPPDTAWIDRHPPNRAFLDAMRAKGIDVAAWRGPMRREHVTPAGRLSIELEPDPLHVLQMGNYFGTCLSEGEFNAYSTVANAWEANKRVAYARDERGKVVGRRLLLLTRAGRLAGFRSYGAGKYESWWDATAEGGGGPWVKVLFDAFARDLADRCGATLHPHPTQPDDDDVEDDEKHPLRLFAKWYHDGCEPFDWFWRERPPADTRRRATQDPTATAAWLLPALLNPNEWGKPTASEATRLLLWLGDDAAGVLAELAADPRAAEAMKTVTAALRAHGVGERVRAWCAGRAG